MSLEELSFIIRWEADLAQQVLEAWVGAQAIIDRRADIGKVWFMLLKGLFEPIDALLVIACVKIPRGDDICPHPLAWLPVPFCLEVR